MTDITYAVDIWWRSGNSMRVEEGIPYRQALAEVRRLRTHPNSAAVARIELVKVVTIETVSRKWRRVS